MTLPSYLTVNIYIMI